MAARFVPARNLDERVAQTHLRPFVDRLLTEIRDEARLRQPDAKAWSSALDEKVRDSHIRTEGQEIPDNLRYEVPSATGAGGVDLARQPRDPDLPIANRANCRCDSLPLPGAVARAVQSSGATLAGTTVRGAVNVRFNRIVDSEYGDGVDQGSHAMGGATSAVAARYP